MPEYPKCKQSSYNQEISVGTKKKITDYVTFILEILRTKIMGSSLDYWGKPTGSADLVYLFVEDIQISFSIPSDSQRNDSYLFRINTVFLRLFYINCIFWGI